jgi:hypothetical protein
MFPWQAGKGCNQAVWLARVANHDIVEIYAAFRHMRGNAASSSPVLGSAPDTRQLLVDGQAGLLEVLRLRPSIPISHDQETSRRISIRIASRRVST